MTDVATPSDAELIADLEKERQFILDHPDYERDTSRPCAKVIRGVACADYLPVGAPSSQRYCPAHQPHKKSSAGAPREPAPRSVQVNIDLPKVTLTKDQKAVEAGALAMLGLIPLGLAVTGDEVCPEAISKSIPLIARQLGILAKYHPGLKRVFAPGESTGEAIAWLGLVVATLPAFMAVAAHHHLLPEALLERVAGLTALASNMVADGDDSPA